MRRATVLLALLLVSLSVPGNRAGAQWPEENHYKVYTLLEQYLHTGVIGLSDQFGTYTVDVLVHDKFANPTEKNGEPIVFPEVHQTWWRIDPPIPTPGWDVEVENQFGTFNWRVREAEYLVLPAQKNEPGPLPEHNHYLGYRVEGDALGVPVVLVDQFGTVSAVVTYPELLLTPVEKSVPGAIFPIIDPDAHLAVYRIDPPQVYQTTFVAFDQFGQWPNVANEHIWLCVPSWKRVITTPTEESTWGEIKSLFRQ